MFGPKPIGMPTEAIAVEFDCRGTRATKTFVNHFQARRFFANKLKAGTNPKVKGTQAMTPEQLKAIKAGDTVGIDPHIGTPYLVVVKKVSRAGHVTITQPNSGIDREVVFDNDGHELYPLPRSRRPWLVLVTVEYVQLMKDRQAANVTSCRKCRDFINLVTATLRDYVNRVEITAEEKAKIQEALNNL